eukprot:6451895-Prymnesium_polylepis.1
MLLNRGLNPPPDATCGLAGHKIVSQPARRRAKQVQVAQRPSKRRARCERYGPRVAASPTGAAVAQRHTSGERRAP